MTPYSRIYRFIYTRIWWVIGRPSPLLCTIGSNRVVFREKAENLALTAGLNVQKSWEKRHENAAKSLEKSNENRAITFHAPQEKEVSYDSGKAYRVRGD